MTKGYVLSIFDRTGQMIQPWLNTGWSAITRDLQSEINPHPNRIHLQVDILHFNLFDLIKDINFFIAFASPPCTHVAVSGAKHFKAKGLSALIESLTLLERVRAPFEDTFKGPWAIENPVSVFSSYWRAPDYYFDPCDYTAFEIRDHYTKRTCIWSNDLFIMPPKAVSPLVKGVAPDARIHIGFGGGDGDNRSPIPLGYARAVYAANCPKEFQ